VGTYYIETVTTPHANAKDRAPQLRYLSKRDALVRRWKDRAIFKSEEQAQAALSRLAAKGRNIVHYSVRVAV
jgi:hypothetical protein